MPAAYPAPSLNVLLGEVNATLPGRPTGKDGWIGDTAHQGRTSDHNPNSRGSVNARDFQVATTADGTKIVEAAVADDRTNYVIFNGWIWSRIYGFRARKYTGKNPHADHVHVSILQAQWAEQNTSPWGLYVPPEGEDMIGLKHGDGKATGQKEQVAYLQRLIREAFGPEVLAPYGADGEYGDKTASALAQLNTGYDGRVVTALAAAELLFAVDRSIAGRVAREVAREEIALAAQQVAGS